MALIRQMAFAAVMLLLLVAAASGHAERDERRHDEGAVSDTELLAALKQVHDINSDIPVLIKADQASQVQKLTFVMDACRQTGLNKFSLQSRE